MKIVSVLLLALPLCAAPDVIFVKSFPGSNPEWVKITVHKDGKALYTDQKDDPQPLDFQLSAEDAAAIFALADKLDRFKKPLESNLPVAKMGEKTFRWEDGAASIETKFNYTQDLDAQALLDWFEKISETLNHRIMLERVVRFDKLGVNKAILQLQASWERKRVVAPDQFLKLLDRVVKSETYMNMARERAAMLAEAFRAGPVPVEKSGGEAATKQ